MTMAIKCDYISSGCNRNPSTLDWGENGIICYGACNAINLWKYKEDFGYEYLQTLLGHKKTVTSVHWIKNNNEENEFISTSADHTAAVWALKENKFVKSCTLIGHTNIVRNASGIYTSQSNLEKNLLVATLSVDSTLKLWHRVDSQFGCIQTISFGNGFGISVQFANLGHEFLMLIGGDDSRVHIYTHNEQYQFTKVLSLEGHEDWIQCLDITYKEDTLMVASASQDCHIRIWKITPKTPEVKSDIKNCLKIDEFTFKTHKGHAYSVLLESVLSGHENWIYSVRWHSYKNVNNSSSLQLLSSSMDKSMIIWEADSTCNIWTEKIRVGEVGGNTLGFLGGVFSPCGKMIIAHGFQGAIHIWKLDEALGNWVPGITFGGHFLEVTDIDWEPEGKYLISCSADQTTRIHGQFVNSNGKSNWYEIARPQVHGYDMVCVAILNRFQFASAGDEKVIRVFQAPRSFAEALKNISQVDTSLYVAKNLAEGASVPSLGLSNKAVFEEDIQKYNSVEDNIEKHPKDRYPDFYYTPLHLTEPPTEETLIQNTLWPEIQKLYGHPYEVFTLAPNHSGTLIASACKAMKQEHASIILWETSNWQQIGQLENAHGLTVTQLEFSPDDEFLLSVSRDRTWTVFRHFPNESPPYVKIANIDKKNNVHTRIIWSCAWTFDSLYFATASRDKKVAVWGKTEKHSDIEFRLCLRVFEVEDSATALAFAPCLTTNHKYILAIGLENGSIYITTWCKVTGFIIHQRLGAEVAHHLTVNKLKFSPVVGVTDKEENATDIVQLASCSNDKHVKIYNILVSLLN